MILIILIGAVAAFLISGFRVLNEYERGVVFRLRKKYWL